MLLVSELPENTTITKEEAVRKSLVREPHNPEHLLNLARILAQKGALSNSLRYYARANKFGNDKVSLICQDEIPKIEKILGKSVKEVMPEKAEKRVLVIANTYPPESGSGVQHTVKLVKYLRYFGWEPVVLALQKTKRHFDKGYEYFDELPDDLEVILVPVIENVLFKMLKI